MKRNKTQIKSSFNPYEATRCQPQPLQKTKPNSNKCLVVCMEGNGNQVFAIMVTTISLGSLQQHKIKPTTTKKTHLKCLNCIGHPDKQVPAIPLTAMSPGSLAVITDEFPPAGDPTSAVMLSRRILTDPDMRCVCCVSPSLCSAHTRAHILLHTVYVAL